MKYLILSLATGLLIACGSSSKVLKLEPAADADFSRYKTFDFYGVDASGDTIPERFAKALPMIKTAISTQLAKSGMTQTTSNPDIKINIGIVVSEKAQTRETDFRTDRARYTGQRNYSWKSEEIVVGYYREGTMDVHLVDAAANKMVWQGTIQDILPEKSNKDTETIEGAVTALFEGFPKKVKKAKP